MYSYSSRRSVSQRMRPKSNRPAGGSGCVRLGLALAVVIFALISYFGSKVYNPVTGEDQYISITQDQEIALGLQAAPEMEDQFGGADADNQAQTLVDMLGLSLVENSLAVRSGYPFEFTLLADPKTVNAFALPGGQVFITRALYDRLESQGQLAGVLGHEIGHVIARHGAEHIAKQELTQGLTGAVILASYDPNDPKSQIPAQIALIIGQLVNMKYGRADELESDRLGVRIMAEAGYDPRALIGVMKVLDAATASGRPPEFLSTHPNPENRLGEIEAAIQEIFPNGVPAGLTP
jgi:predicted Zn-dependent protease